MSSEADSWGKLEGRWTIKGKENGPMDTPSSMHLSKLCERESMGGGAMQRVGYLLCCIVFLSRGSHSVACGQTQVRHCCLMSGI